MTKSISTEPYDVNRWNERFAEPGYFYGVEANDFLQSQLGRLRAGAEVLCLGEGEGRNAVFLAQQGMRVTALDGSPAAFKKLAALAESRGVQVNSLCVDLAAYRFEDNKWDAIVSIWCHLPSQLRKAVHADVGRALKPDGLFILEAYTPEQLKFATGGPKALDLLPTLEIVRDELSNLKIEVGRELERDVQEGRGHGGRSAVVQFVGRK